MYPIKAEGTEHPSPEPEPRLLGVLRDAAEHQLRRLSARAGALVARPQGLMRKKKRTVIFTPKKDLI